MKQNMKRTERKGRRGRSFNIRKKSNKKQKKINNEGGGGRGEVRKSQKRINRSISENNETN